MVKQASLWLGSLLSLLVVIPGYAELEYDQFMNEVGSAQRQLDHSKRLVNRQELDAWIQDNRLDGASGESTEASHQDSQKDPQTGTWMPELKPRTEHANSTKQAKSEQNSETASPTTKVAEQQTTPVAATSTPATTQPESRNKETGPVRYVWKPKSAQASSGGQRSYSMKVVEPEDSPRFGIPIGTQIKVRLNTGASSVQPGYIQVETLEDVIGHKRSLSRGSTLFLRVQAINGSSRLFGTAVRGITALDSEEFGVRGNIFGADGQPGFDAVVISDGRSLERATDAGLEAIGEGVLGAIPDSSLAVDAGRKAAGQLLDDQSAENDRKSGRLKLVVQAQPQIATLQIEETF